MCRQTSLQHSLQPTLGRLVLCTTGICTSYILYGVLQEKLVAGNEPLGASFVLLTQGFTNSIVAVAWGARWNAKLPHYTLFFTTVFYVLAMVCSNEAIQYVSYPVNVLAKSCKLIPTMIVSQIVESKYYGRVEWLSAFLICLGIGVFQYSRMESIGQSQTIGNVLLAASLTMDGVLGSYQNLLKRPNVVRATPSETMLYINLYAILLLVPIVSFTNQWPTAIIDSAPGVLALNATVGVGQIFIFYTISIFSPITTTIITTTRKFLTILISVKLYGHSFTALQWGSILTVFSGLYLAIVGTLKTPTGTGNDVSANSSKKVA